MWSPATESARSAFAYGNLGTLWSSFVSVGADRLILSALVEDRSDLEGVAEAVPGAVVTLARLHAPLAVLEQRIRSREVGGAVEGELDGARWWTRRFEEQQLEDFMVETEGRPVREIAEELLRRAGWFV